MRLLAVAALAALLPGGALAQSLDGTGVKLEGLDKITARTFAFEAPLNQPVSFGYLQIVARACVATPEEAAPESTAFLEVTEAKPGEQPVRVFTGWMFASSPSASAMEHPVYDIWVVACTGVAGQEEDDGESSNVVPPPPKPGTEDFERSREEQQPLDDQQQPLD